MADLRNFRLTAQADASLTVARVRVEAEVLSDDGRTVRNDFTGLNAIVFALRVPGFSAADHRELAEEVATWIIRRKAGLA